MARTFQDGHGKVLDPNVLGKRNPAKVVSDRVVEVDRAPGGVPGRDPLRVRHRRQLRKATRLDGHEHGDGVDVASGHLTGAFDWKRTYVYGAVAAFGDGPTREMRLVPGAEHDGAREARGLERSVHRVGSRLRYAVSISFAEEPRACQRRSFRGVHELERKLSTGLKRRNAAPLLLHASSFI
jgi:hypothetical protein